MCMYVCVCRLGMYACMNPCISTHMYTHMQIHRVSACVYTCVCYTYCTHTDVHTTPIHTYITTQECTHTHARAYMDTGETHTYMRAGCIACIVGPRMNQFSLQSRPVSLKSHLLTNAELVCAQGSCSKSLQHSRLFRGRSRRFSPGCSLARRSRSKR